VDGARAGTSVFQMECGGTPKAYTCSMNAQAADQQGSLSDHSMLEDDPVFVPSGPPNSGARPSQRLTCVCSEIDMTMCLIDLYIARKLKIIWLILCRISNSVSTGLKHAHPPTRDCGASKHSA